MIIDLFSLYQSSGERQQWSNSPNGIIGSVYVANKA